MSKANSAGILLYRLRSAAEVFLVHPGGPFWARKDAGAWSIPKGEYEQGADALEAAKREFNEETGCAITGNFIMLVPLKQRSGKTVHAWAVEGDLDATSITSNLFSMEWPPRSGKQQQFPEVDQGAWFTLSTAKEKILAGQRVFLDELERLLTGTKSVRVQAP